MDATAQLIQQLTDRGLSQAEIGRRAQIPQFRLSRWARGKAPVGANDALRLKALVDDLSADGGDGKTAHVATVAQPAASCAGTQKVEEPRHAT